MDGVFFWASKLIWVLISPDSLLLLALLSAYLLLLLGMPQAGRRLLGTSCLCASLLAILPVGEWLVLPLETRFQAAPTLGDEVDGIIVLGGFVDTARSAAWGQVQTNEAAERLLAWQALARRYPQAKLVFTGGNGSLRGSHDAHAYKESSSIPALMHQLGLAERSVQLESESRNTWENVQMSHALLSPAPDEHWLLVTSAAHMPRAVGIFCTYDWPVQPYPVDFRADRKRLLRVELAFAEHLLSLRNASREWVGLIAYYLTGKTTELLPSSSSACGSAY